ncbi:50S ribosomal protein L1 [Patescibacteria group bacterium]|nr:50S ribosomal protein L1 [Patescibacteria group bacterium]MBU1921899.1 50S ribosomal protein L1 [Patescibacteria group bacterium]
MSKRLKEAKKLIDPKKVYAKEEAIELAKKTSTVKFDASVEVHVKTGINPSRGEQQIRSTLIFPHSFGVSKRVAAFVESDKEKDAKEAGADLIGAEDLIEEIKKSGKIDFDVAVATPDMMPKLAKIAKILGPRGLMPNPKTETVGPDVKKLIQELKQGKITFKTDDTANVHQIIGKVSMDAKEILENLNAFIEALRVAKPSGVKGNYIKNAALATSMGPSIKIEIA